VPRRRVDVKLLDYEDGFGKCPKCGKCFFNNEKVHEACPGPKLTSDRESPAKRTVRLLREHDEQQKVEQKARAKALRESKKEAEDTPPS